MAERLADLEEDGLDIGAVRIYKATPDSAPKVMVRLSDTGPCSDLPKDYLLKFSKCEQKMHLFCEDIAGRAMMIEGKVDKECHMNPIMDEDYRQIMQKRNVEASKPKRTIQVVDTVEDGHKIGLIKHVNEYELIKAQKARTIPEEKKERLPRKEVMDMIFHAFERYPHWNFKGLVERTQQPSVYLKEILSEVAIYNKRGPFKNLYELRPEYKRK
jgi:transcription initiation factor TFIIF subunit beta